MQNLPLDLVFRIGCHVVVILAYAAQNDLTRQNKARYDSAKELLR